MARHLCLKSLWEGREEPNCFPILTGRKGPGGALLWDCLHNPYFSHSTHLKIQILLKTSRLKTSSVIFIQELRKG